MKVKTQDLTEVQLDWAVAKCLNWEDYNEDGVPYIELDSSHMSRRFGPYKPSIDWEQAGPIIEEKYIELHPESSIKGDRFWTACPQNRYSCKKQRSTGITPLIAAMRYYVKSCLGNEVEIPDELIKK